MKRRKKRKKPKADQSFSNMRIHIPYLLETKGMGFFVMMRRKSAVFGAFY